MRSTWTNRILRLATLAAALAIASAGSASATPIVFSVTVHTGAINGISGFLDFSFAPGNDSQGASVTIDGFTTDGALTAAPDLNGGASGTLPGTLSLDNSTQFNDYFQAFTFGSTIDFVLSFDGPAVTSPNLTSTSGSTFSFGMFDDTGLNPLLTIDPNGTTFIIDLDLSGSLTTTTFAPNATDPSVADVELVTPEPASCVLLALGLAAIAAKRRRKTDATAHR
jgi:hypothetical protein